MFHSADQVLVFLVLLSSLPADQESWDSIERHLCFCSLLIQSYEIHFHSWTANLYSLIFILLQSVNDGMSIHHLPPSRCCWIRRRRRSLLADLHPSIPSPRSPLITITAFSNVLAYEWIREEEAARKRDEEEEQQVLAFSNGSLQDCDRRLEPIVGVIVSQKGGGEHEWMKRRQRMYFILPFWIHHWCLSTDAGTMMCFVAQKDFWFEMIPVNLLSPLLTLFSVSLLALLLLVQSFGCSSSSWRIHWSGWKCCKSISRNVGVKVFPCHSIPNYLKVTRVIFAFNLLLSFSSFFLLPVLLFLVPQTNHTYTTAAANMNLKREYQMEEKKYGNWLPPTFENAAVRVKWKEQNSLSFSLHLPLSQFCVLIILWRIRSASPSVECTLLLYLLFVSDNRQQQVAKKYFSAPTPAAGLCCCCRLLLSTSYFSSPARSRSCNSVVPLPDHY